MTFLNPLLLFGLFAASIPILIHLLNLRKLKTIEFSSLQFLKELQKTKMRRVKIKQWLLLALRTLMIISVVLAFARPAMRGLFFPLGGSTHAKTTLVVLLDDSPSMSVRTERGILFSQAKEAASRILDLMKDGDEAYLIRLSDVPDVHRSAPPPPVYSAAQGRKALGQLSEATTTFRDVLAVAAKILGESKNLNQEIYLITDAQASHVIQSGSRRDTTDWFDDNVKLFLVDVRSAASFENAGITNALFTSKIISQERPLSLQASLHNAGSSPLRNSVVSLYLDGARVAQQSVDVASQSTIAPTLQFSPRRRGMQSGYLQLEDDALDADNRRYFTVQVPTAVRILAIGASSDDTRLPSLALTLDKDSSAAGFFDIVQATESKLSSSDLSRFDILLLANVKDFSAGEAERIAQFIGTGGGVLMFPGNASDINNYNSAFFTKMGIPPSLPRKGSANPAAPNAGSLSFLSFGKVDFDHALFDGLFEETSARKLQRTIESPKIYSAIQPQTGPRGRSVISLSDGTNFLTEYRHGAGTMLLFAVEAGMTWSDFPLKGIFVPLLYRSGLYLAQSATGQPPQFTVGEEIRFSVRLKQRPDKDAYVLRSPSGIEERVAPRFSAGAAAFSSPHSSESGVYELRLLGDKDSEPLYAFAVNVAKEETDLRHASDDELKQFFAQTGLKPEQWRQLPVAEKIDAAILASRFGVELWKYFVGLAIALALLEMIVGRESRESRA